MLGIQAALAPSSLGIIHARNEALQYLAQPSAQAMSQHLALDGPRSRLDGAVLAPQSLGHVPEQLGEMLFLKRQIPLHQPRLKRLEAENNANIVGMLAARRRCGDNEIALPLARHRVDLSHHETRFGRLPLGPVIL